MPAIVLILLSNFFHQTPSTLYGIVVDKSGNPLMGCNVVVKGTVNGTVTDSCGQFSITIAEEKFVVVFRI